jgi:hypothetical protein
MDIDDEFVERHTTAADNQVFAARFGLPTDEWMVQEWEWIVSEPELVEPLVEGYRKGTFTDSQKYLLMKIIIDSCNLAARACSQIFQTEPWRQVLAWLRADLPLHGYTVCCFASLDTDEPDEMWDIAPAMRGILASRPLRQ